MKYLADSIFSKPFSSVQATRSHPLTKIKSIFSASLVFASGIVTFGTSQLIRYVF
jgi:hypothetical protein